MRRAGIALGDSSSHLPTSSFPQVLLYVFSSFDSTSFVLKSSNLKPSATAAVYGGNVLTSQRIVDVVLKAFIACAASQGCCKCVLYSVHLIRYPSR